MPALAEALGGFADALQSQLPSLSGEMLEDWQASWVSPLDDSQAVDLLLDLMLPGMDGLEVCRRLKSLPEASHVPVIMITAKTEESDVVVGLECGADDYITKPFSPRVLLARVKAILRTQKAHRESQYPYLRFGDLAIHPGNHEVLVRNKPVDLTTTEFRILLTLARRPGWVFTREQIVDSARGTNTVVTPRSVDVHIVRLRSKLGFSGELIETVRGFGYRFRRTGEDS